MQKEVLVQKIQAIRIEMEPLAIKWAKIREKKFKERFEHLDDMTLKDLEGHYMRLKAIHKGTWTNLKKIWDSLPQAQWETTFLLGMRHLPEYADLQHALIEFRFNFMGKKRPIRDKEKKPPGTPDRRGRPRKDAKDSARKS